MNEELHELISRITGSGIEDDQLLTTQQTAKLLGLVPATVYRYAREGVLPHVRIGRTVRFRLGDIRRLIRERTYEGR